MCSYEYSATRVQKHQKVRLLPGIYVSAYLILLLTTLCTCVCLHAYYSATRFQEKKRKHSMSKLDTTEYSVYMCPHTTTTTNKAIYTWSHTNFSPHTASNMASGGLTLLSSHTSMQVTDPRSIHVSSYYCICVTAYYYCHHTRACWGGALYIYVLILLCVLLIRYICPPHTTIHMSACYYIWRLGGGALYTCSLHVEYTVV